MWLFFSEKVIGGLSLVISSFVFRKDKEKLEMSKKNAASKKKLFINLTSRSDKLYSNQNK